MPRKNYHHGDLKNALITAGVEILAKDGAGGLSLRKVAQKAGVSHSAPYSHFPDKQSLIAAISTEGFNQLHIALRSATEKYKDNPQRQLMEGAGAYVRFAMQNTDTFKIMFSGILEKEKEYPSFVDASRKAFEVVVDIIQACQGVGLLRTTPPEMMAVAVWGQVHGIISLALEGQISHTILDEHTLQEIVLFAVEQMVLSAKS